jgi:putative ABC transport system permease protein
MIFYMGRRGDNLIVRVSQRTDDVVRYFEEVWGQTVPEIPLQLDWLGDAVAGLYEQETRTLRLLSGVAVLAIGVACLGLFAVAQLVMELRRREVALRKVFGATMLDIVNLLSWRFIKFIALANVIALPIAWFYLSDWLTTFVYRIELEAAYLLAPAVATLVVAWLTVAAQAWVVARRHPISALRYE